jgi:glycosyltransferase involved in cell wall biosynthesis
MAVLVSNKKKVSAMKLSVIMPAFNEEKTIALALDRLLKVKAVSEVVVIDDASTDSTKKVVKQFNDTRIALISHEKNQGKGAAIRTGLARVKGDYVLIQDADLEYDPRDIPAMMKPVIEGKTEIVYGSRFTGPRKNMFFWHMVGNKFLSLMVNVLYNTTLSDMETCYKLVPTKLMRELDLNANDFTIEPEITCKILKRKYFIYEVPISYNGRTFEEGKKITWRDGIKALGTIVTYTFWR